MSFLDVIAALGRRWWVTVVGLLATAALAWGATVVAPPVYTARALVLLVPSEQAVGEGGNPFLALAGLDLPARVVVAYYESDVAKARFTSGSPDAEYVVAIEESTRGPVIAVDVTDESPQRTLETLDLLTASIPVELQRLQDEVDVPQNAIMSTLVLAKDERTETDTSGTVRMLIAAVAGGLVATGVAAVALDGILRGRERNRQKPAAGGAGRTAAPQAAGRPAEPAASPAAKPAEPPAGPLFPDPPPSFAPSVPPPWHNPPRDTRERRPDDEPARASSAEPR